MNILIHEILLRLSFCIFHFLEILTFSLAQCLHFLFQISAQMQYLYYDSIFFKNIHII